LGSAFPRNQLIFERFVTFDSILTLAAVGLCVLLVVAAPVRKWSSVASWCFAAGMLALAVKAAFSYLSFSALSGAEAVYWQRHALIAKSFVPGFWLCFSVTYARGNSREFLVRWKGLLLTAFLLPVVIAFGFQTSLVHLAATDSGETWIAVGRAGRVLNAVVLVATVLILSNLEKTFRATVGTTRWRIKFLVLGLGIIFGARIYTGSQALLFSGQDVALAQVESIALIMGCCIIGIGYLRSGFSEIDIYPSHEVLQGSVTMLIAGGYLFVVGVLAQMVTQLSGVRHFQAQAFLVLLGLAGLAMLLLSDRVRQRRRRFISRHFQRSQYDFRKIWTLFTERTSASVDEDALCSAVARLICETFDVLSVTIWLVKEGRDQLVIAASTSQARVEPLAEGAAVEFTSLRQRSRPFDLETEKEPWAEALRHASASQFRHGGDRIAVPLLARDRWLGLALVADRVNGLFYTDEELDLLQCIGSQLGASLQNLRLAGENLRAKELEAFQTLSAFFVHDLKNAASGLNLTLQNLPIHFDDPAFRADALRGIANTVNRINSLIGRLSLVRGRLELEPIELDLNQLVRETLRDLNGAVGVELKTNLTPLPSLMGDREQLRSVINNLVLNARDAVNGAGRIEVATRQSDAVAILTVTDNGCGMSADFVRDSLFRPFRTTKKQGIGIGMFQAQAVIQAHGGSIFVESHPKKGSTFRVILPITASKS
jgi:putative PEP-CTERM system histidine kinase